MDNYELNNNEVIYPIFQMELEGKKYLFYSNKEENLTDNDIYVGEELNDELLPVDDVLLPVLEQKYQDFVDHYLVTE